MNKTHLRTEEIVHQENFRSPNDDFFPPSYSSSHRRRRRRLYAIEDEKKFP